jgi:cell division septal protein FtsQ
MAKKRSTKTTRRSSVRVKNRGIGSNRSWSVLRYVAPIMLMLLLVGGTAFFASSGYRTATASTFFALRDVDVRGTHRVSQDEVKRIVTSSVERLGVWNADLEEIRGRVEKLPYVRYAAVSRSLPSGISVNVTERVPIALIALSSGNYLVDEEGTILSRADGMDEFPFTLTGWDESKTEKAIPENLTRLRIYRKMVEEWQQFDLAKRVREVNLRNTREPIAVVDEKGRSIPVTVSKDKLAGSLKAGIEAISGKGEKIRAVDSSGVVPVIQYADLQSKQ